MNEGISKYPSYYKLQKEKKKCYPDKSNIVVTETSAKINLQALLDLTTARLFESLVDSNTIDDQQLILISKWGFDGASDQSIYKQKSNEDLMASVFMASLVPLKLVTEDGEVIWQNERPSSTSYCRPIMWKFMKENKANVLSVKSEIDTEISELTPTIIRNSHIKHQLLMTMIDGKIASYISDIPTSSCTICEARPREMNELALVEDKPANEDMYKYGLSSLHAWIRCMECLLHIAYRLEFKTWQARGDENKKKMNDRKLKIQEDFRRETGLLLDVVKQGSGTTNDGNSARRFFGDPDKTASLTGLDVGLVKRFAVILQCISSGEKIKIPEFKQFCQETNKLYMELYPWYNMPPSVHKLLVHGSQIIEHLSVVPIGFLSEEVSESRNKDFRRFREHHSRKISGKACNEDILNNLLISLDPVLAQIRPRMDTKSKRGFFKETYELLVQEPVDSNFVDVNEIFGDTDEDTASESSDNEEDTLA